MSSCSASLNVVQSRGYSNGYYRGGRWGDPWGAAYYQPPVTTAQPQMAVDWTNITHKVMTEVQFGLIANAILKAEAKDMGKFSPNAEIKHKYGIPTSTFPLGTGLPQCVPLHIIRHTKARRSPSASGFFPFLKPSREPGAGLPREPDESADMPPLPRSPRR